MIKSIRLENFQSHRTSLLEFDPGVNVIIGTSDSGKTAIYRAFDWVHKNRPSGDSYRSWSGGETVVEIDVDGSIISRIKGKENLYTIDWHVYPGEDSPKDIFKAFGQSVPQEITDLINMTDLNIQRQHDGPFLLSKTAGEAGKYINQLIDLEEIDISLSNIASTIRKENGEIQQGKIYLQEKILKRGEFNFIPAFEKALVKLEGLSEKVQKMETKEYKLISILNSIKSLERRKKEVGIKVKFKDRVEELLSLSGEIKLYEDEIERLSGLISKIQTCQTSKERFEPKVKFKSKTEVLLAIEDSFTLQDDKITKLRTSILKLKDCQSSFDKQTQQLLQLNDSFNTMMPDICPLCEQEIKHEKKKPIRRRS